MEVVVRQFNGIGNQLFQYAAGRFLAKKLGASLRVAHEIPGNSAFQGKFRPVLLNHFQIRAPIRPVSPLDRVILSLRPHLAPAGRLVRTLGKIQVIRQSADEIPFAHNFQIASGSRIIYLVGYWQDYSIVREVEPELRREFRLAEPLRGSSLEVAERICDAQNPVSLHVRRGDYMTAFGARGLLPMTYYDHAIRYMIERHPNSTFFAFSDDAEFIRSWGRRYPRLIAVDQNDDASAHEVLKLMSLCRHHVIANSTFSWWAAWFNSRPDKQVIAPARWLGFATASMPIACPGWILMPSEGIAQRNIAQSA